MLDAILFGDKLPVRADLGASLDDTEKEPRTYGIETVSGGSCFRRHFERAIVGPETYWCCGSVKAEVRKLPVSDGVLREENGLSNADQVTGEIVGSRMENPTSGEGHGV